ncbi:hypothetical protein G6F56_011984 [Rhizopus delemar]|nr:hypothetical protein G6F56_011984 [Rhizopus delemar]
MSNNNDRKRRRNSDTQDLPSELNTPADASVLLPSSPVPFLSEFDRNDILEEDIVDDGYGDNDGSDGDGIDLFNNDMEAKKNKKFKI